MTFRSEGAKIFTLDPDKTALVVVDMQNEFVRKGGLIYVEDAIRTIPNIKRLVQAFRQRKRPIVYTKAINLDLPSLKAKFNSILYPERVKEKSCVKGLRRHFQDVGTTLDCTDVVEEIYPEAGDIVIEKAFRNAFESTPLDHILRVFKIEYLVIVGTATHVCVDSTAKGAFDREYMAAIVSDAVSSYHADLQAATLKGFQMMWGRVMTTEEVLEEFQNRTSPTA